MRTSDFVLFVCGGLLLSGGVILGGSTAWSLLRMSYYFWTSDLGAELSCSVLFVAGSLLCMPVCWLATIVPYHRHNHTVLATIMVVSTAAMMVQGAGLTSLAGLSRALREPQLVNASMRRAMASEPLDGTVRSAFAAMHFELQCCGVSSPSDWYEHRSSLPPSCCKRLINGKIVQLNREACEAAENMSGCLCPALSELRNYVNGVAAISVMLVTVLGVTLFTAVYILVVGVLERETPQYKQMSNPLRLTCLHGPPEASSFVTIASPVAPTQPTLL